MTPSRPFDCYALLLCIGTAPFGSRTVNVTILTADRGFPEYLPFYLHDDNIEVYVNGSSVLQKGGALVVLP